MSLTEISVPLAGCLESLQRARQKAAAAREEERIARGPAPEPTPCPECGQPVHAQADGPAWRTVAGLCLECQDRARELEEVAARVASLGLSERERAWTFEAVAQWQEVTDSQRQALERLQDRGSVWLCGRPGCGKSHMATAAAIALLEAEPALVERWTADALLRKLSADAGEGLERVTLARMRRCDLLILDDLDAAAVSEAKLSYLHDIADHRWRHGLWTVVTSNLAPEQVAAKVGERVTSRLATPTIRVEGIEGRRLSPNDGPKKER